LPGGELLRQDNVIQAGYPLDMRYAGPREGLLHATFRQNYGVNNMLIGRDHAGVGDFYGLFEAQEIFDRIPMTGDPGKDLLCKPAEDRLDLLLPQVRRHGLPADLPAQEGKTASSCPAPSCARPCPKAPRYRITSAVTKY
jgi:hypothetical protein